MRPSGWVPLAVRVTVAVLGVSYAHGGELWIERIDLPVRSSSSCERLTAAVLIATNASGALRIDRLSALPYQGTDHGFAPVPPQSPSVRPVQAVRREVVVPLEDEGWQESPTAVAILVTVHATDLLAQRALYATAISTWTHELRPPEAVFGLADLRAATSVVSINSVLPVTVRIGYDTPCGNGPPREVRVAFNLEWVDGAHRQPFGHSAMVVSGRHADHHFRIRPGMGMTPGFHYLSAHLFVGNRYYGNPISYTGIFAFPAIEFMPSVVDLSMASIRPLTAETSAGSLLPIEYGCFYDTGPGPEPPLEYGLELILVRHASREGSASFSLGTTRVLAHEPRANRVGAGTWNVPGTVSPGVYDLMARIDPAGQLTQVTSSNDTLLVTRAIRITPPVMDVSVHSISTPLTETHSWTTIPVSLVLSADSPVPDSRRLDFQVEVFLHGVGDGSTETIHLGTVPAQLRVPSSIRIQREFQIASYRTGTYYLGARILREPDRDPSNDSGRSEGTLGVGAQSDISVRILPAGEGPQGTVTLQVTHEARESLALEAYVTLFGSFASKTSSDAVGPRFFERDIRLMPGESQVLELRTPLSDYPAMAAFRVMIEAKTYFVSETDLSNNVAFAEPLTSTVPPDDHPDSPSDTRTPEDRCPLNSTQLRGVLETTTDVDVLRLDVARPANVTVRIRSKPGEGFLTNLNARLLGPDGTDVLARARGNTVEIGPMRLGTAATYYLEIRSDFPGWGGAYEISAAADLPDLSVEQLSIVEHDSYRRTVLLQATLAWSGANRRADADVQLFLVQEPAHSSGVRTRLGHKSLGIPAESKLGFDAHELISNHLAAGRYRLAVEVDGRDQIIESDERNNYVVGPAIELGRPFLEDSAILLSYCPTVEVAAGAQVPILTALRHTPLQPRVPLQLSYFLLYGAHGERISLGHAPIDPAAPFVTSSISIPSWLEPGRHSILTEVERPGFKPDDNPDNDRATTSVTVEARRAPFDFRLTRVEAPRAAELRKSFDVGVTLHYRTEEELAWPPPATLQASLVRVGTGERTRVGSHQSSITSTTTRISFETGSIPVSVLPGSYLLEVTVVCSDGRVDLDATNNVAVTSLPVQFDGEVPTPKLRLIADRSTVVAGCGLSVRAIGSSGLPSGESRPASGTLQLFLSRAPRLVETGAVAFPSESLALYSSDNFSGPMVPVPASTPSGRHWVHGSLQLDGVPPAASGPTTTSVPIDVVSPFDVKPVLHVLPPTSPVRRLAGAAVALQLEAPVLPCASEELKSVLSLVSETLPHREFPLGDASLYELLDTGRTEHTCTVPAEVPPGRYRVRCVVPPGVLDASESASVISTRTLEVAERAMDLSIVSVHVSTGSARAGERFEIEAKTRLDAAELDTAAVRSRLALSLLTGCSADARSLPLTSAEINLEANRSIESSFSVSLPFGVAPGHYLVNVTADPENRIRETDERNNSRLGFGTLNVRGASKSEGGDSRPLAEGTIDLHRGLDVLSIPIDFADGKQLDAADLVTLTGASLVVNSAPDDRGLMRFQAFGPGLGSTPFPVVGGESYLVLRPGPSARRDISGRRWPRPSLLRRLGRGTNLVSYPLGVPSGETASSLTDRTNAIFVARTVPGRDRLQLFLPGLTPDFDIEAGRGYVVSVSAPTELLLPSCEP